MSVPETETKQDLTLNDNVTIKEEPDDAPIQSLPHMNGFTSEEAEDLKCFTKSEIASTQKCLENCRLVIKDFETQLDWHVKQYIILRNFNKQSRGAAKKNDDDFSISALTALIASHSEGNKNFIKLGPKRQRMESEADSDFSEEDEDEDDEDFSDSEDIDDPDEEEPPKKRGRGRKKAAPTSDGLIVPKEEEIEEEIHELVVPKEERNSEEEDEEPIEVPPPAPKKRGRKPADPSKAKATPKAASKAPPKTPKKTPAPRGRKSQKKNNDETIDLTNNMKGCSVVLNRVNNEDGDEEAVDIKNEDIDRDELEGLIKAKLITEFAGFQVNYEKPIVLLEESNLPDFDFNECSTSNVIVLIESNDVLPEFVFTDKRVSAAILNGLIKIGHKDVFDNPPQVEN